jgi:hypothetical protein
MKYLVTISLLALFVTANGQNVKLVQDAAKQKVDVMIGGKLFTSFCYPSNIEKPFLYPVYAPNGAVITRGYPIEPRKGERIDHPHHIGMWFNHSDVNKLDFWNNSSAIPAARKDSYGHIAVQKIVKAESGKTGVLEVVSNWDDNKGNTLLTENTKWVFSGDKDSRTIDHISTLTAVNGTVEFNDNKDGLFAIRVDRAFEMPTNESVIYTDANGNPTTVKAVDNTGVTGMYKSSAGLKGDAVWGTKTPWVVLTGVKDNVTISFGLFDHPKNINYPAYSHARNYGLFSINNIGRKMFDAKQEKFTLTLNKGESVTFRHRFYLQSGSEISDETANKVAKSFAEAYK